MSGVMIGAANPAWKGGPPTFICAQCGAQCRRHFTKKNAVRRFCDAECYRQSRHGSGNPKWKGGIYIAEDYVLRYVPEHPRASTWGYVHEHVLVAEKALGHPLPDAAVVHHVNEDGHDNWPTNLVICENQSYHVLLHTRMRARRKESAA